MNKTKGNGEKQGDIGVMEFLPFVDSEDMKEAQEVHIPMSAVNIECSQPCLSLLEKLIKRFVHLEFSRKREMIWKVEQHFCFTRILITFLKVVLSVLSSAPHVLMPSTLAVSNYHNYSWSN